MNIKDLKVSVNYDFNLTLEYRPKYAVNTLEITFNPIEFIRFVLKTTDGQALFEEYCRKEHG